MEFSTFKLKRGVSESELFTAVDKMVEGLYSTEEGFLGHAVLKGADDTYVCHSTHRAAAEHQHSVGRVCLGAGLGVCGA